MKKFAALLLSLVMLLSLVTVPVAADDEDVKLKITPSVTEGVAGSELEVTYTIAVEVKSADVKIGSIQFYLVPPEGMTLATEYIDDDPSAFGYYEENLKYDKKTNKNGIFDTKFEYTPESKYFCAMGTTEDRNLHENATLMTIKAKIAADASGDLTLTARDVEFGKIDGGTVKWTYKVETTPVSISTPHTHVFDQKNTDAKYLASAASCTAKATYYYSCTCGEKGTATFESGETLPHTASTEWKSDEIYHWHVCTTCNAELDKAAHNPGPAATETTPQTCTVCGYEIVPVLPHTHDYVEVVDGKYLKTAAGCDNDAVYYKSCSKCHEAGTETFTAAGTALGHSYTAEKVADQYLKDAAGCETDAVYFKSCARCGAKGTETFTVANSALGHKGGAWQSDETGHWKVCERVNCGKRFNEGTHDGGKATCQAKAACTTCGAAYGELGAHDMDTKWSSNDTQHFHKCLTKGCDYIKDAADHSGGKATCKEKAKCDVCAAEYGNLGAHTLTKTAAKAPTCLEPGNNEYYTCSVCGKVFKDAAGTTETTVAAETLAKSTTHVVESKYATSATEHWQICKVCGTVVGKAAHKFGEADANGRKTCADCGYTVGGTGTEGHKHAAGNTICYDENNHWNKCTDDNCDAHVNESAHKFGPKNTVTEGNKTITIETCSECGYVKRTETTTGGTTPVNPGGNKPTKPGTKDNGKTVQSGKTFDAGVGVYVGLSILSLTGSAVVIGKKRKTR